jgi:hypothetical protein
MVRVEALPDSSEEEEVNPTIIVEPKEAMPGSGVDEDDPIDDEEDAPRGDEEDCSVVAFEPKNLSGWMAIDEGQLADEVESKYSLDLMAVDEGQSVDGVDLKKSLEVLEDGMNGDESSLDLDSSVQAAAPFKPRRRTRNTSAKKNPSLKSVAPPKLSRVKRKPAFKKGEVLQVSVQVILLSKG